MVDSKSIFVGVLIAGAVFLGCAKEAKEIAPTAKPVPSKPSDALKKDPATVKKGADDSKESTVGCNAKDCEACLDQDKSKCFWSATSGCKPSCATGDTCFYSGKAKAKAFCLRARCSAQKECAACLAVPGCNWTGGTCADQCLMDTSCFGPGNKHAPTCPEKK